MLRKLRSALQLSYLLDLIFILLIFVDSGKKLKYLKISKLSKRVSVSFFSYCLSSVLYSKMCIFLAFNLRNAVFLGTRKWK